MASAADRAAQNFSMPALSPTMTEGNIASWKIKEGESFTAGDVLLEIETDKATMDVEAQDDGILFKIIQGNETKGVKVGERIAVTAEEGDDINSLEMPAESNAPAKAEASKAEGVDFPVKVLRGFEKTFIKQRETVSVTFNVTRRDLSYWDVKAQNWKMITEGKYGFAIGTSSKYLHRAAEW